MAAPTDKPPPLPNTVIVKVDGRLGTMPDGRWRWGIKVSCQGQDQMHMSEATFATQEEADADLQKTMNGMQFNIVEDDTPDPTAAGSFAIDLPGEVNAPSDGAFWYVPPKPEVH